MADETRSAATGRGWETFVALVMLASLVGVGASLYFWWIGGVIACIVTGYIALILGMATNA